MSSWTSEFSRISSGGSRLCSNNSSRMATGNIPSCHSYRDGICPATFRPIMSTRLVPPSPLNFLWCWRKSPMTQKIKRRLAYTCSCATLINKRRMLLYHSVVLYSSSVIQYTSNWKTMKISKKRKSLLNGRYLSSIKCAHGMFLVSTAAKVYLLCIILCYYNFILVVNQ